MYRTSKPFTLENLENAFLSEGATWTKLEVSEDLVYTALEYLRSTYISPYEIWEDDVTGEIHYAHTDNVLITPLKLYQRKLWPSKCWKLS